jgi:hypothetical protein
MTIDQPPPPPQPSLHHLCAILVQLLLVPYGLTSCHTSNLAVHLTPSSRSPAWTCSTTINGLHHSRHLPAIAPYPKPGIQQHSTVYTLLPHSRIAVPASHNSGLIPKA